MILHLDVLSPRSRSTGQKLCKRWRNALVGRGTEHQQLTDLVPFTPAHDVYPLTTAGGLISLASSPISTVEQRGQAKADVKAERASDELAQASTAFTTTGVLAELEIMPFGTRASRHREYGDTSFLARWIGPNVTRLRSSGRWIGLENRGVGTVP